MSMRFLSMVLAGCLVLVSCGGGGGSSPPDSPASSAPVYGFDDPGALQGKVRSDLPKGTGTERPITLTYGSTGCKFPSSSENNTMFGCPGYREALPKPNGAPGWSGNLQQILGCRGDTSVAGDTWLGCLYWNSDNFFSLNNPVDTYWVTVTNTDPAFDQCNYGPPGASNRIGGLNDSATFKVGTTTNQIILEANADDRLSTGEWYCKGTTTLRYAAPFMSVGAEKHKGQSKAIMPLKVGQAERLTWQSRVLSSKPFGCVTGTDAACSNIGTGPGGGVWSGVLLNTEWGGAKRGLFVMLHMQGHLTMVEPQRKVHWNWPVKESFFYPGYDLGYITPALAKKLCNIDIPSFSQDASPTTFSIDVAALMKCASDNDYFSQPITGEPELNGVHWFVEFTGTEGKLRFTIENPQSK